MNPNIEVITPELWAVHSGYIKAGWIQELTPIPGVESSNEDASLTNDGIMILKKESELYPLLKKFIPKIMKHTDAELEHCITTMKNKTNPDNCEKMYLDVLQWETKRRYVRAEYLNSLPKRTFKDGNKKFLRKVGEKYGYYPNGDSII